MTTPDTQQTKQLTFEAGTPTEFRALLSRIRTTSGLSCGQIAIKTGMPRSTAYSLPDVKRPGLPSNPDQVRDFVEACGLTSTQVDLVMDRWQSLHDNVDAGKATTAAELGRAAKANDAADLAERLQAFYAINGPGTTSEGDSFLRLYTTLSPGSTWDDEVLGTNLTRHRWLRTTTGTALRSTSWTDLLHYVLGTEDRTRRALRLLLPLMVMVLAGVIGLVLLAVLVPATALYVAAGLLLPFIALALTVVRGVGKPTATRKQQSEQS